MRFLIILILFPLIVKGQSESKRYVAFTFDDLPYTHITNAKYINQRLTEILSSEGIPAIGFVNEGKLYSNGQRDETRIALIELWLSRGFDLGNHSYSHVSIDNVTLDAYKTDVLRGEKITKYLLAKVGKKLKYYRHTQLRTGQTPDIKKSLDNFLKENGYVTAPVTLDNNEYIFADIYERALQKNDSTAMSMIRVEYLRYMETIVAHFEDLSVDFLGYEVRQILLLHANTLNADCLSDLIDIFRKRNYAFISLDEALQDKAYQLDEVTSKRGLSWIHRWMLAKGYEMRPEPSEPEQITQMFENYR
jgi:peptidoglycan/xylan/chitin deacetylase (PgdA/CDA1 family)